MEPIVSIVIVNYNYGRFLEDALKSIFSQVCPDYEVIIIDGGSKDNSVEIIRRYADKIAWWCSEPDRGQSNAFNKGFSHAKGRFLTWLNADDILVPGTVEALKRASERHPDCEWFTGNFYRFLESSGQVIEVGWGPHWYPGFLQRPHSPIVVFGPTSFFSKVSYERAGQIDESMRFMMDTDLWIRFMRMGIRQRRINKFCWAFRMHGASKTAEYGEHKLSKEDRAAFERERTLSLKRNQYQVSQMLYFTLSLWRIMDGSFLYGRYLDWSLRHSGGIHGSLC